MTVLRKIRFAAVLVAVAIPALAQDAQTLPPGMLPYIAIAHPEFVAAKAATFLQDDYIVIGVAKGKVAKAFPSADLTQHGTVDDQMPDGPIEVTWCGVCNTGAVFSATHKGQVLHFDYDSMVGANEVHIDKETGSRWQQSTGDAISGPLKGDSLDLYPFIRTTWQEWRKQHPDTLVLKPLPEYAEKFAAINIRMHQGQLGEGAAPKTAFGNDDRLRPKEVVAGLRIGNDYKAYPFTELRSAHLVNDNVGGVPILVVHQSSSDTTTMFEARVKGKALQFQALDAEASKLMDTDTHSTWNAYGLCVEGSLKGTRLKALIPMPEYWFAWSEFHPGTQIFTTSKPIWETLLSDTIPEGVEPKVSALFLDPPPGMMAPAHSHAGPVFAYILQGEIENQVDPEPPKTYQSGGFFYEPTRHTHRMLHNLSATETARLLVFQVGDTGKANPAIKIAVSESFQPALNQEVSLNRLTLPASGLAEARKYSAPALVYVLEGKIETSGTAEQPMSHNAGDLYVEAVNGAGLKYKNASDKESAKIVIFQVNQLQAAGAAP